MYVRTFRLQISNRFSWRLSTANEIVLEILLQQCSRRSANLLQQNLQYNLQWGSQYNLDMSLTCVFKKGIALGELTNNFSCCSQSIFFRKLNFLVPKQTNMFSSFYNDLHIS
jgi:hypothetical protein